MWGLGSGELSKQVDNGKENGNYSRVQGLGDLASRSMVGYLGHCMACGGLLTYLLSLHDPPGRTLTSERCFEVHQNLKHQHTSSSTPTFRGLQGLRFRVQSFRG